MSVVWLLVALATVFCVAVVSGVASHVVARDCSCWHGTLLLAGTADAAAMYHWHVAGMSDVLVDQRIALRWPLRGQA